jgi:hypothetical protein
MGGKGFGESFEIIAQTSSLFPVGGVTPDHPKNRSAPTGVTAIRKEKDGINCACKMKVMMLE